MTIVAFAGPSLAPGDRSSFSEIDWRPPAEAGDVLRLMAEEVSALCLIDGYFDHRPAVRHKELLLLLAKGVPIFGASSIGALRAAEMEAFGMIGIGAVFAAYARGGLTGDDEVALIHAGPERDWRSMSVPLVDVRATLCAGRRAKVIEGHEARALLRAATSIHYVDRQWRSVCAALAPGPRRKAFESWLEAGAVSQKRADALACLAAAIRGAGKRPELPRHVHTCFVDALARECGVDPASIRPQSIFKSGGIA